MHYTLEILLTIALIELMWALALYIEHRLHKLIKRKSKQVEKAIIRLTDACKL